MKILRLVVSVVLTIVLYAGQASFVCAQDDETFTNPDNAVQGYAAGAGPAPTPQRVCGSIVCRHNHFCCAPNRLCCANGAICCDGNACCNPNLYVCQSGRCIAKPSAGPTPPGPPPTGLTGPPPTGLTAPPPTGLTGPQPPGITRPPEVYRESEE